MDLPLRTERLVLRRLTAADLDEHARVYSDPDVVRYLYEQPLTREEAWAHLEKRLFVDGPDEDVWLNLAVEEAATGRYLGEVGVVIRSRAHRQCEVGYVFGSDVWGRGYATEAVREMVAMAFDELEAHRVCGRLDARNTGSAGVLQRLGMRHEGHLRENEWVKGEWTDEVIYAITEEEWRAAG